MKSAVLLIAFNRPDLIRKVVDRVRQAHPPRVFAYVDGPRPGSADDPDLVEETRRVLTEGIDWSTDVSFFFSDTNRGITDGPPDAIDWFFSQVPEGIILEDDCVPHPDFFGYCDDLLERHRNNTPVWGIGGDNSLGIPVSAEFSYGFISDPLPWGWATWARAWAHHDRNMMMWTELRASQEFRHLIPDRTERRRRRELIDTKTNSSWHYRWSLTVLINRAMFAVPRHNLISNVGFNREDATHTVGSSPQGNSPTQSILPLNHPIKIELDGDAQKFWVETGLRVRRRRLSYQTAKFLRKTRRKVLKIWGID